VNVRARVQHQTRLRKRENAREKEERGKEVSTNILRRSLFAILCIRDVHFYAFTFTLESDFLLKVWGRRGQGCGGDRTGTKESERWLGGELSFCLLFLLSFLPLTHRTVKQLMNKH